MKTFWERAGRVGVIGHRDFNPGWHTALDLKNLLTVSEAITRAALERKESRGAQFRDDYPDKDERFSKVNTIISQGGGRRDASAARAAAGNARLSETDHRGDEMNAVDFQHLARRREGRRVSRITRRKFPKAWSCSMPFTTSRRSRRTTWPAAGTAKRANAAPVPRKSTACRS